MGRRKKKPNKNMIQKILIPRARILIITHQKHIVIGKGIAS